MAADVGSGGTAATLETVKSLSDQVGTPLDHRQRRLCPFVGSSDWTCQHRCDTISVEVQR